MSLNRTINYLTILNLLLISINPILCGQLLGKQSNLAAEEIDPNVSPIKNRPPIKVKKPIKIDNSVGTPITTTANDFNNNNIQNLLNINQTENLNELNTDEEILTNTITTSSTTTSSSLLIATSTKQPPTNVDDQKPIDKFCKCSEDLCNCCRELALPLLPVRGLGCAKIQYLGDEKMSVQIKYGDIVLASRTINGKNAAPICVGLPGGYNRFCARFYGLAKEKTGFKSCMSLELRAEDEVEAQLRVSCFKFGKKGFSVTEAEPIPLQNQSNTDDDDDDDDDDDFFGLAGGGADDDESEETDDDADDDDDEAPANTDDDSADYDFRFIEEIFGSETEDDKKNQITDAISSSADNVESPPQTKTDLNNNVDANSNDADDADDAVDDDDDQSKTIPIPNKELKSTKTKHKDDEDYDMADIIFGILNLF